MEARTGGDGCGRLTENVLIGTKYYKRTKQMETQVTKLNTGIAKYINQKGSKHKFTNVYQKKKKTVSASTYR